MNAWNILLVDDNEAFLKRLKASLNLHGMNVITASNTEEALNQARTTHLQAAILDLNLGSESGLQLINPLKHMHSAIRIVLLTGYASIPTAMEAARLGVHTYVSKPCTVEDLIKALFAQPRSNPLGQSQKTPTLDEVEWNHIQQVLQDTEHNISETARRLGIPRRTLQRKLQKYSPHICKP